jgi:hypothetical protein
MIGSVRGRTQTRASAWSPRLSASVMTFTPSPTPSALIISSPSASIWTRTPSTPRARRSWSTGVVKARAGASTQTRSGLARSAFAVRKAWRYGHLVASPPPRTTGRSSVPSGGTARACSRVAGSAEAAHAKHEGHRWAHTGDTTMRRDIKNPCERAVHLNRRSSCHGNTPLPLHRIDHRCPARRRCVA